MRRFVGIGAAALAIVVLIGLVLAVPRSAAQTFEPEDVLAVTPTDPVVVTYPVEGQVISLLQQPDFRVQWSRHPDTLFYLVRLSPPPDEYGEVRYVEFRYEPDASTDINFQPHDLTVATGLLNIDTPYTIEVTPYGPTQALLDEYNVSLRDALDGYITFPSYLPMENYVQLAPPSAPVTIFIAY